MRAGPAIPLLLLLCTSTECRAQADNRAVSAVHGDECLVSRLVDGDTFRCTSGIVVRLIGVDTPERGQGELGARATAALRRMLSQGTRVELERDVAPNDRYGRALAYVWLGDTLVNEAMVRGGWALLYTVPPNVKYVERLRSAEQAAREANAGLWARHGFDCAPKQYRARRC